MKEFALVMLILLLLKNLQVVTWDDSSPQVDLEGTHQRITNLVEGDS